MGTLQIADTTFSSRLFLGTGKFASDALMAQAIQASESQLVTVALKRINTSDPGHDGLAQAILSSGAKILPNTSGAQSADEAVFAAKLAREALGTNWIKLEIHPDPRYLMPDPIETLKATEQLVKAGFVVMPYISADPVVCKRLEDAGAAVVMPLGAPIGSNLGLATRELLRIIIEQSTVPVVVDAGIGLPSHAAQAMELGASAVLVNTAIAAAGDPVAMAHAFKWAVQAGAAARQAVPAGKNRTAAATSPMEGFFDNL